MNLEEVNQIAKAVLYEGYMLYPYRPSSVKNRQRFNFGVLYPTAYCDAEGGSAASSMRTECLILGGARAQLEVRLRFLQLQVRLAGSADIASPMDRWQEGVEREISVPALPLETLIFGPAEQNFQIPAETVVTESCQKKGVGSAPVLRRQDELRGKIMVSIERIRTELFRLRVDAFNVSEADSSDSAREQALLHSLVSAHLVLGVDGGEFVSLLEPPEELQDIVQQCHNNGAWPVLVGNPGERDTLLASPIILYDYPQIAAESPGDLFDGTEIDEILSLRIMTLSDEEKREIRESDERARKVLERTENMPPEQFMKLHGAVRSLHPLKEEAP